MSHVVTIRDIVKRFGDFNAVDHINLTVQNGEFFTLLGPSGCGKTTLLRMIAGFNEIDNGQILFDEKQINDLPAHKRNIGMVFQNYAVFPHMTVWENVAYGLKARNIKGDELNARVNEGLQAMKIEGLKDRQPSQLSGGQQQRVALARSIVIRPDLLLMDEPLSNLDAKLRLEMRSVIRKLQKSLSTTTIYVTHDQEEALAISDRIAVINAGKIEQIDTPDNLYNRPANRFVAGFIGTSNFISASAKKGTICILDSYVLETDLKSGYTGDIVICVRPEQIQLTAPDDSQLTGSISTATFLGSHYEYEVILPNSQMILINQYNEQKKLRTYDAGDQVGILFSADHMNVYNSDGTEGLL